jgi:hypothetical protein
MKDIQLYKYICVKYPHINYIEGEDLSLDGIYAREVAKRWADKENYPCIIDIAYSLDLSERQVYRISKQYNLGKRPLKLK